MDDTNILKITKELASDFLTQMGLDAEVEVNFVESESESGARYLLVKLEGEHLNELIGYHGKNLEAAQIVLGLMLNKKLDGKGAIRVLLEINNYRDSREKYLQSYALRAADQVRESGQDMELTPMKPFERRIIHMTLQNEEGISTESKGEGDDRRIVIKKIQ